MVSHCACPTRVFRDRALHEHRRPSSLPSHLLPSLLVLSQDWELIDLPLRATFSPAHPLANIFHPPHPPIASKSISWDVPVAQARAFRSISSTLPYGEQPDCPSLRALREHILIVRPQRARRMVWTFPSCSSQAALIFLQRVARPGPQLRATSSLATTASF